MEDGGKREMGRRAPEIQLNACCICVCVEAATRR